MTTANGEPRRTEVFMSKADVARHIGLGPRSLSRVRLPKADARIGPYKGWRQSTIDEWNAQRPGRGRWGARPRH